MPTSYDSIIRLTSPELDLSDSEKIRLLNDFSHEFGWTPNDRLEVPTVNDVSSAHLIVEHGLENQAVISFLTKPYHNLTKEEQQRILCVSYNNLVDWHMLSMSIKT